LVGADPTGMDQKENIEDGPGKGILFYDKNLYKILRYLLIMGIYSKYVIMS